MAGKLAGWIILGAGLLIFAGGAWYAYEAGRFIAATESTTGEVVEHEFSHGLNTGYREVGSRATQTTAMYMPIVEFRNMAGLPVRFKANWSEGEPPPVGTTVPVRYPAQTPEDARIDGVFSLFGGAAILFLIGGIFAAVGSMMLKRRRAAASAAR